MMTLGPIGFLAPWLLLAGVALPLIWWLLRFTPPRPNRIVFPPTRLLRDMANREETPARSPWWLTALRILVTALVILALARPLLYPDREAVAGGKGPLVIVVDNGWAAANGWEARRSMMTTLVEQAERASQPVIVAPTAASGPRDLLPVSGQDARSKVAELQPLPYAPDRAALVAALKTQLTGDGPRDVVWLNDGLDYGGAKAFGAALTDLAGADGNVTLVDVGPGGEALGVAISGGGAGKLTATVKRAGGPARAGRAFALSARGERLGEADFSFDSGAKEARATFSLPLEIRNEVARIELEGEHSAGAVNLLDAGSKWRRVGIMSGEAREQAQPLLSPAYYIKRALNPFAEVLSPETLNVSEAVDDLLSGKASVLIMADIGTLVSGTAEKLNHWVDDGGVLVRFAGPRLEGGGDTLLPVRLRQGGRVLGGSLSWSTPQKLAPFEETSLFSGLTVPDDVRVNRQVLADPNGRDDTRVWARLADGTPLVTAERRKKGWVVLFHVTANSGWSNLPLSGLFVEMLRRLTTLSDAPPPAPESAPGTGTAAQTDATRQQVADRAGTFSPHTVLDGFGRLGDPSPGATPIAASELGKIAPSSEHPPGYYGPAGSSRTLNVLRADTALTPITAWPQGAATIGYQVREPVLLAPWLFLAAFLLFLIDALCVLAMSGGLRLRRRGAPAGVALVLALAAALALSPPAHAQATAKSKADADAFALKAALATRLAYVITGDDQIDRTSRMGLEGLSKVLTARTAVEPDAPMGIDIASDELAFFPLLYWPVPGDARRLSDATLARVDAYMKQGGMIVFDTRDYQTRSATGGGGLSASPALKRLIGELDIPPLEPVPENHVLTKSFYLLSSFPGRWDGGTMWVEARSDPDDVSGRQARRSDGVSSVLVTSNDLAAAWALDDDNRPLYPTVPGGEVQREMAFRTGINIVMYALTGNYKSDQVHVPALLERLGQ